ncbi:MAG TPA: tetratricopeptide repeat protein [Pseudomonadales bacterium]|nr:tetratricopeptide repeat protein [Pseudomonadales bacterium]
MKSGRKPKNAKSATLRPLAKKISRPQAITSNNPWLLFGVCAFLVLIVWIIFGQTWKFNFVNFDDEIYVYDNPNVSNGLTLHGIAMAFTAYHMDNWVPLTVLSHMLDCQIYGLNAGGHHLSNVALHATSAVLLFLILHRMTAALWRSAVVGALFAIHPLSVESVVWISARKDVLNGVFFMLTLLAYASYARKPASLARYLAVLLMFALGLMCKSMSVTMPFVLLLIDYWPLRRFNVATFPPLNSSATQRLFIEKVPFVLISAAVCVVTFVFQKQSGAVKPLATIAMPLRLENTVVSYARYLGKTIWPDNLSVYYPMPTDWVFGLVVFSVALLAALCVVAVVFRKKFPFLFVGWFWFLGMLVPVIGLVKVGDQAMADRYMYLPQIGLYLALTWFVADLPMRLPRLRLVATGATFVIIAILMWRARDQTSYWVNSETLWTHALDCTSGNVLGYSNLGDTLFQNGQTDKAIAHYQEALKIDPGFAQAHNNLGIAFYKNGQVDQAISEFNQALTLDPQNAAYLDNLGDTLLGNGQVAEAIKDCREASKIDPDNAAYHDDFGDALYDGGQMEDAVTQFQAALKIEPYNKSFQNHLAQAILKLATSPDANIKKALELARQANQLSGDKNPLFLRVQAAVESQGGLYSEAVETARLALSQATKNQENPAMIEQLQHEIAVYQAEALAHGADTKRP